MKTKPNYETRLFFFLDSMNPGYINIEKQITEKVKFINTVKAFIDTGTFNDFVFSNDYKYLIKKRLPFDHHVKITAQSKFRKR